MDRIVCKMEQCYPYSWIQTSGPNVGQLKARAIKIEEKNFYAIKALKRKLKYNLSPKNQRKQKQMQKVQQVLDRWQSKPFLKKDEAWQQLKGVLNMLIFNETTARDLRTKGVEIKQKEDKSKVDKEKEKEEKQQTSEQEIIQGQLSSVTSSSNSSVSVISVASSSAELEAITQTSESELTFGQATNPAESQTIAQPGDRIEPLSQDQQETITRQVVKQQPKKGIPTFTKTPKTIRSYAIYYYKNNRFRTKTKRLRSNKNKNTCTQTNKTQYVIINARNPLPDWLIDFFEITYYIEQEGYSARIINGLIYVYDHKTKTYKCINPSHFCSSFKKLIQQHSASFEPKFNFETLRSLCLTLTSSFLTESLKKLKFAPVQQQNLEPGYINLGGEITPGLTLITRNTGDKLQTIYRAMRRRDPTSHSIHLSPSEIAEGNQGGMEYAHINNNPILELEYAHAIGAEPVVAPPLNPDNFFGPEVNPNNFGGPAIGPPVAPPVGLVAAGSISFSQMQRAKNRLKQGSFPNQQFLEAIIINAFEIQTVSRFVKHLTFVLKYQKYNDYTIVAVVGLGVSAYINPMFCITLVGLEVWRLYNKN